MTGRRTDPTEGRGAVPASGPAPGGPPPRRFSPFGRLVEGLNAIGTLMILGLVVFINADVLSLNLLNRPIPGVKETVGLAIAAIVFLQLASTLRADRHIRNDLLEQLLRARAPRAAAVLRALFNLFGAALLGLIVWFCWPLLSAAYRGSFFVGSAGVFTLPTWPMFAVVMLGGAVTVTQYLLLAWRELRLAFGPEPPTTTAHDG